MRIFVVEDDPIYAEIIRYHLELNPENEIEIFQNGQELLDQLYRSPSAITIDYRLPDMSGEILLEKIQARKPNTPIIVLSSQENVSTAISLLKKGAKDYIVKDDDAKDRLWNILKHIKENEDLKEEIKTLRDEVEKKFNFKNTFIGESPLVQKIFELLEKAAKTDINVSITGETGTGKEVAAKAIHFNSSRKNKNFVPVNMAAIPSELMESELFGHEKGAFTGASARRIGKFEEANNGTLFLDEIGELDMNVQAKLLRVLQENELTRIGSNTTVKLNVRVITATHKNLAEEVKNGNFRKDLYYRLIGLPIQLPPLRDRGNDILLLANFFLKETLKRNQLTQKTFSNTAQQKLMKYHYPGNIRELKSVVELATVLSDGQEIEENAITFNTLDTSADFMLEEDTLKGYTRKIIQHYLDKYDHNIMVVSQKLDIGKSTIYQMIKNNEIN